MTALTEGLLLVVAAVETLLVAGLALIAGGVDRGSGVVEALRRVNDLLIRPFTLLPFLSSPSTTDALPRQIVAIVVYGAGLLLCVGVVSWLDRRRALY